MNILGLFIFLIVALTQAVSFINFDQNTDESIEKSCENLVSEEWELFKLEHKKNYATKSEGDYRKKIYISNRLTVAKHNAKYARNKVSFKLKLNKYADMLRFEVVNRMNGFNKTNKRYHKSLRKTAVPVPTHFVPPANVKLPESIDWRKLGAVTEVKDQGECGSCWAFSTTGSIEGQHFRRKGYLISVSEQNLIDCSSNYGNDGCNGGLMDNAFEYVKNNKGIESEKSYKYEARKGECRYQSAKVASADDTGFSDIIHGDEEQLMAAVATIGPISVAIDASHQSFQFYSEGIYDEPNCSSTDLDHGVLVVGYGTDENGRDYWIVKNSWNVEYGEQGYIRMSRNKNNQCGIASSASFPLV